MKSVLPHTLTVSFYICRQREKADSRAIMLDVITADGELFPVKRKLLRPCISLTHAVRDTRQASVSLDSVDTLVFDRRAFNAPVTSFSYSFTLSHRFIVTVRCAFYIPIVKRVVRPRLLGWSLVHFMCASSAYLLTWAVFCRVLIYLEAEAAGRSVPDFAVHLLGDLLHAAEDLGCRSLQVQDSVFSTLHIVMQLNIDAEKYMGSMYSHAATSTLEGVCKCKRILTNKRRAKGSSGVEST